MKIRMIVIVLVGFIVIVSSCASPKNLQYFQGNFDTTKVNSYNLPKALIQKGDLLSIVVYSDNPEATAIYNQSIASPVTNSNSANNNLLGLSATIPGYLVDENGDIHFQGLGRLHIEGLTKEELNTVLVSKLKEFLKGPYLGIRFLNYKITIVGDVARPSVYNVQNDRISILEAIGLSGDLNITARRDNILVIREQNGVRNFGRIDLTKPDIFNSPYFYLKQNDVIYVDFNKSKAAQQDQVSVRNITLAASIISTIAILINVLK